MKKRLISLVMVMVMVLSFGGVLPVNAYDSAQINGCNTLSLGGLHSGCIKNDNSLWVTGANDNGQLGTGDIEYRYEFTKIMENVESISFGETHSAAIKKDGSLWLWGSNAFGEIGDGTTIDRHMPIKIMDGVKAVSLSLHSGALKNDGSLWTWGFNSYGSIGDGTTTDRHIPVKIMENVKTFCSGFDHSAAITNDGDLYMWGTNDCGQLGNGSTENEYSPVKIMENVKSIGMGTCSSAAIKEDNSLWMWGYNGWGELGDGTTTDKYYPIKIMDNVKSIHLGGNNCLALKMDGSLWSWGANWSGQVGNGTESGMLGYINVPVKIADDVITVSFGAVHGGYVDKYKTLWMWGSNFDGELGDGTDIQKNSPQKTMENIRLPYTENTNLINYTTAQRPHIWLNSNSTDGTYLGLGNTFQSGLQVYPLSAYPESVVWHSTNPAVASVSQSGLITGNLEGYANIYVTTPDGVTSDAMKVVVTDLSKSGITATDKVSSIGYGSNYEWIVNNKNFLYWHAWLNNDSNAGKYYFQNYLCAPLFDMGEIKNLYSGVCSVQRAKEILLSFVSDTYDRTFSSVKTELSYKIGKKAAGTLASYLNAAVDKDYGARLDALGEKNIITAFENNSYEGGIQTLAEYLEPENPESVAYLMRQCLSAEAISDCFSGLSKVIDFKNTVATIGNEVINVEIAAQTNDAYCDTLDYLAANCIDSNVRRAAREIKDEMSRYTAQNIVWLASQAIALKSLDETTDWVFDKVFSAITGGGCIAKLGADMGIFVSNELMHADDTLKCADNIRLISYISVAMTSRISDIHLRFISETDPVLKENYAKELIEQYNILISARKLGEENYYNAYKYNPFNFVQIKELFGIGDVKYEQWYSDTMTWLEMAKNNPEKAKPTRHNADYEIPSSASLAEASDIAAGTTPYTADEFYGLFADKGLADAVVYSLGTDSENPDWDIVTHEAVEQLEVLHSEGTIADISGISALHGLKYLDLSNQNIHTIPDEITELKNLKGINLFNNGITEYPYILNEVASLESVGMGYNLLTEYPDVPEGTALDVMGNLLNPDEYLAQRYLYCEMPIIYDTSANLYEMIDLKDMYGIIYDYNGAELFADGVEAGEAIYSDSITVSVSNSSNPNANIVLLVDESDNTPYTEERFIEAFPDEAIRAAVLSELGMNEADYEKITDMRLAEISELSAEAVTDMTGINLLKGLNTLTLEGATFTKLPSQLSLLSNLQTLSLRKSKLNSLAGIGNIKELSSLNISECLGLEDITAIKDIEGLESLYADGLGMSDILSVIEAMPSITALSVSGNCIEDIDVLLNRQFDYLNISGNYLDIDDLENSYTAELMNNCRKLVYSPQIEGLVKDISFTEDTVSVTLENTTKTNFNNFTLITAIYQNGALTDVKQTEVEKLEIDEITSIDVGLSEAVQGDTVKCFVWEDNDMEPLCRAYIKAIDR